MIRKKPIDFILEKKRREKQLMEYKRKSNSHNLNPSTNIEVQPDKENVMSKDRTRVNKLIKVDKLINRKENIMEEPILSEINLTNRLKFFTLLFISLRVNFKLFLLCIFLN